VNAETDSRLSAIDLEFAQPVHANLRHDQPVIEDLGHLGPAVDRPDSLPVGSPKHLSAAERSLIFWPGRYEKTTGKNLFPAIFAPRVAVSEPDR